MILRWKNLLLKWWICKMLPGQQLCQIELPCWKILCRFQGGVGDTPPVVYLFFVLFVSQSSSCCCCCCQGHSDVLRSAPIPTAALHKLHKSLPSYAETLKTQWIMMLVLSAYLQGFGFDIPYYPVKNQIKAPPLPSEVLPPEDLSSPLNPQSGWNPTTPEYET